MTSAMNPINIDFCRRQEISKVARGVDRMGWIDRPGSLPSLPMPGQGVRIHSLKRRPDLNDMEGYVMHRPPDHAGRVMVKLIDPAGRQEPLHYRVNPVHLERPVGPQVTADPPKPPRLLWAAPTKTGEVSLRSDVSSVPPHLASSRLSSSAPVLPPADPASFDTIGLTTTKNDEVHKRSGQGRGYCRRKDGGFFASPGAGM